MSKYSIKDLERLSGIKAHTIRIWEKRYGLISPKRTPTNIRYYTNSDLKLMLNIATLKRGGYKISIISELTKAEIVEKVNEVTESNTSYDTYIESLLVAAMEFADNSFHSIMEKAVSRLGFEQTAIEIIYPFLGKLGLLWQLGSINPAQEHFISNLIRNTFIVETEKLNVKVKPNAKCMLLFLPEGELHELGLLFYNYLIIKAGHKTLYLGQSLPLINAQSAAVQLAVDGVVTTIVSYNSTSDFTKKTNNLSDYFPELPIILTNRIDFDTNKARVERLYFNLSLKVFNEILETTLPK